jgi:electron transfer flavoprotein beta subunit
MKKAEPLAVGKAIRAIVEREGVNLVMCGKQSIDDDSG